MDPQFFAQDDEVERNTRTVPVFLLVSRIQYSFSVILPTSCRMAKWLMHLGANQHTDEVSHTHGQQPTDNVPQNRCRGFGTTQSGADPSG